MSDVLILRPQPGADQTADRAQAMGLAPVVAPLFTITPLPWQAPDADKFEALVLTSANAARQAGDGLTPLTGLACYAVGEATAVAAREVGFKEIRIGPADGAALFRQMEAAGVRSALHLCGRDHRCPATAVAVTSIPVYAAEAVDRLPPFAAAALRAGAVALLHSPRAAALFGDLVGTERDSLSIAAISAAAAEAVGPGWSAVEVAAEPRDQALLEAAAKLCHRGN